jgi:hypothetical protein
MSAPQAMREHVERLTSKSPWINPRTGRGSRFEYPISIGDWQAAARGKEAELEAAKKELEQEKRAWLIEVAVQNKSWPGALDRKKPSPHFAERINAARARVQVVEAELETIKARVSAMLEEERSREPVYHREPYRWNRGPGLHRGEVLVDGFLVVKGDDGVEKIDLFGTGDLVSLQIYYALQRELRAAGVRLGGKVEQREARIDTYVAATHGLSVRDYLLGKTPKPAAAATG